MLAGENEPVRAMPWSIVTRYPTAQGYIYLKEMTPLFAHEPRLLALLNGEPASPVPRLIADNPVLRCFLMRDAGQPLRPLLKENYRTELLSKALQVCANLQKNAIGRGSELLAAGAMDWRPARLPDLLRGLLANEPLMQTERFTPDERAALTAETPGLISLCNALTDCGIPETLEHGDFHDNNILLQGERITINDWGDASISHPFFSLVSCLESARRNHDLQPGDARYGILKSAYLDCWRDHAPLAGLETAFALAQRLRPVQFSINYSRLAQNVQYQADSYYAGWIADSLRRFVTTAKL